jgi:hypothetical protein
MTLGKVNWVRWLRVGYWIVALAVLVIAVAPVPDVGPAGSDKFNHLVAFLVLAAGAALLYPASPLWLIGALLIAYGGAIELIQGLPFVRRDCDFLDWLTDIAGVAAALLIIAFSGLRVRLRVDKSPI